MTRPRIAVIAGYMPFFDEIMPPGHPAERDAVGRAVAALMEPVGEISYLGLVRDHATGAEAGRALAAGAFDAVLLAPTMATPAGYLWAALEQNASVPVVIFAAHDLETIEPSFDMPALCRNSSGIGAMMIGNMLSRAGRMFRTIVGSRDDAAAIDDVHMALRVAALSSAIRRGRLGLLGRPLDGYDNVSVDATALKQAVGMEIVDIPLAEWEAAHASLSQTLVGDAIARVSAIAELDDNGQPEEVVAAARMSCALQATIRRHGLMAGALNCRGEFGVRNDRIASLGCLAVSEATTGGVPFTCTADVITAIAMMVGQRLGGTALYCELDAIDADRDAILCANTGEGDFNWLPKGARPCVFASGAASGRYAPGCSVQQTLRPGPATAIGFSPRAGAKGGFTLIAMEGETQEPPELALTVTSAWFKATRRPMRAALANWIEAGATHHCSLSAGHLAAPIADLAAYLGIGFQKI